jgi:hypothetical protein
MTGKRQVFNGAKTRPDCGFSASDAVGFALGQAMFKPQITDAIIALLARLGPVYQTPCLGRFAVGLPPREGVFRCAVRATRREKATRVLRAGIWLSRLGRQVLVEPAKRLFLLDP